MESLKKSLKLKVLLSILLAAILGLLITLFIPEHIQKSEIVSLFCSLVGAVIALFVHYEAKRTSNLVTQVEIYSHALKLSRKTNNLTEKAILSAIENTKFEDPKAFYKFYLSQKDSKRIEIAKDLDINELVKIHELQLIAIQEAIIKDMGNRTKDELKAMTVTQLFLLEKRKELSKAKFISIISAAVGATSVYFRIADQYFVFVLPLILSALLACFELVLTYRIEKGFFGANKYEAIQLLQYIEKNQNDFDNDGRGGFNRKIFNDLKESSTEYAVSIESGVVL
ncbi:hypothetical protein [Pantoea ananatis]|uniref:hypothetical protein n=1 Tax=Pantoea ananas TaxID=553 RepID=UPI001B3030E2|nr:hypothetical protein [Pantoea ananatis]